MTKVQRHYELQRPLDDALLEQIGQLNSIYGIERVRLEQNGNLFVEYDATRLSQAGVETAFERAGVAVSEVAA